MCSSDEENECEKVIEFSPVSLLTEATTSSSATATATTTEKKKILKEETSLSSSSNSTDNTNKGAFYELYLILQNMRTVF